MSVLTLDEAQKNLPEVVERVIEGQQVVIKAGSAIVRLVKEVPIRVPGHFAECYRDSEDAAFEERLCRDSQLSIAE